MPQGARKVEDPRPLRDKAYMSKSIRKLIVYLSEHGYDRSISSQILTSPTTKDFLAIISFMFANIDPNFKFIGKFEDEIPGVLKLLAYPTSIGRSALTAALSSAETHLLPRPLSCGAAPLHTSPL